MSDPAQLADTAQALRRTIVDMVYKAGSGHSGGSLSCCEILTVLYDDFLRVDPAHPQLEGRDRFILSKGHAAPALYATLARKGFIDPALLDTLRAFGSPLQGHPCMKMLPGIEMSTGSLGMGLSVACGMALSMRRRGEDGRVWVLCGDGELQEGCNWEAMMSVRKWGLNRICMIVDYNGVQLDGTTEQIMPMAALPQMLEAFGWTVIHCDGHDTAALQHAFAQVMKSPAPCAVAARTVKGKGVRYMEGQSAWHGKTIGPEDYQRALADLEARV